MNRFLAGVMIASAVIVAAPFAPVASAAPAPSDRYVSVGPFFSTRDCKVARAAWTASPLGSRPCTGWPGEDWYFTAENPLYKGPK